MRASASKRSAIWGEEVMEYVLLVLFVLVVVTLVGHGIWVVVAGFFRLLAGDRPRPEHRPQTRGERCIGCAMRLRSWERVCPDCGLDQQGARAVRLREAEAIRQVRDLLADGVIDEATTRHVVELLDDRRRS